MINPLIIVFPIYTFLLALFSGLFLYNLAKYNRYSSEVLVFTTIFVGIFNVICDALTFNLPYHG